MIEDLVGNIQRGIDPVGNYQRLYDASVPSFERWAVKYAEWVLSDAVITQTFASVVDAVRKYENGDFLKLLEMTFRDNMREVVRESNQARRRAMRLRRLVEQYNRVSPYQHCGVYFFETYWKSSVENCVLHRSVLENAIGRILAEIDKTEPATENMTKEWAEYLAKRKAFFEKYGF